MKFILDIDGTLLNGPALNLDAGTFVSRLNAEKIDYLLMTNAVAPPMSIAERLYGAGLRVDASKILNPIVAINQYLKTHGIHRVFVVGGSAEIEQLDAAAYEHDPGAIVLIDFERINADYELLQKIFDFVQRGIPVLSASGSKYYLKHGVRRLDTGAFTALFKSLPWSSASRPASSSRWRGRGWNAEPKN